MRTYLILGLGLAALAPARAQLIGPGAVNGALFGGLVGGIIGHDSGRHGWEGAAIGASAGLLLGSLADQDRGYAPQGYPVRRLEYVGPAVAVSPTPATVSGPAARPAPVPARPMDAANALFGR